MDQPLDTAVELARLKRRIVELEALNSASGHEAYLQTVFDHMQEGLQILDSQWRYLYLNLSAANHGRRKREELLGKCILDEYPGIDQTDVFKLMQRCMHERIPLHSSHRFTYPNGQTAWFDTRITPVAQGILIFSVDISAQKAIEEDLRQSRENLATTLDCMAEGVVSADMAGRVTHMNPAAEDLLGWMVEDAQGQPLETLARFKNQQTGKPVEHVVEKVLREGVKFGLANDTVLISRDGTNIPIASSGAPIRDAQGAIRGVVMVLKNMKDEYELAAQLSHAQKMENIGRLAGGIAHDFNNLLTVINGYGEMLTQRIPPGDRLYPSAKAISDAGSRAVALTRQLLAFSRKQVLQPEVVDINSVIQRTTQILNRLIGENIILTTNLKPDLYPTLVDPGQLEQVLMNLAINARDAMGHGGRLTIETGNVDLDAKYFVSRPEGKPGPYVMLAITDTGVGMDAKTQARIFEPFFTTKEKGKGTGLGLSTVYGIVKQSGGNIWLYSEPGIGTTFKVYFPRADAVPGQPVLKAELTEIPKGTGTILVVEDEISVRMLIREILETGGYTVLEAGNGQEALEVAARHTGEIHMLLSDVVLPHIGGRELSHKLLATRPKLKVVFMSGYTENAIIHNGTLDPGSRMIEKPILPNILLRKVGEFMA